MTCRQVMHQITFIKDYDRVNHEDTSKVYGKEFYPIGPIKIDTSSGFSTTKEHCLTFIGEDFYVKHLPKVHNQWECLHDDSLYVLEWFAPEDMWLTMMNYDKLTADNINEYFFMEDSNEFYFLFYARADYIEIHCVPAGTECPFHLYKRGLKGEYYKVIFPISDDIYQQLLSGEIRPQLYDRTILDRLNDSLMNAHYPKVRK